MFSTSLDNFLLFSSNLKLSSEHSFSLEEFNPFPNDKFLDVTKLKAFADEKLNVAKISIFLFDKAENTVVKGENAGYQHFLLFPQCFPMPSSSGSLKVGIVC